MSFGMRGINNNLPNQNDRSNHAPRRLSFYADQNQHEIIDNDDYYQEDTKKPIITMHATLRIIIGMVQ